MESFNPLLGIGAGFTGCFGFLLLAYNGLALFQQLREPGDETASGLAKGAWALSILSMFLGPCALFGAVLAIILASVERRRIYAEKSTLVSTRPCRMASLNGWVLMLLSLFLTVTTVLGLRGVAW